MLNEKMLNEILMSGIVSDPVIVLGTSSENSETMREMAEEGGIEVKATTEWTGPTPEYGSYEMLSPIVRMSTPEFFFYRKANQLDERDAVILGCELVSLYRSQVTAHNLPNNVIEELDHRRTTIERLEEYVRQVEDEPEGKRALEVLDKVRDEWREYEELMSFAYVCQFMFR